MSAPLDLARELEAADERLAREIEDVAELQRRAAAAGERAAALGDFALALPHERRRLAHEGSEADLELAARQAELDRAEAALAAAQDEPAVRRAAIRAADLLAVARARHERATRDLAQLESQAESLPVETSELAAEAAAVTDALAHAPVTAPPPDLRAIVDWASRARAALLLARSGLDARREQIVREANELAASVVGEPVGTSVAGVRELLERRT